MYSGSSQHKSLLSCNPAYAGCFCMTELGHGSNVAALQTECVLDTTTDEWVVNTPDDSAIKWYNALPLIAC